MSAALPLYFADGTPAYSWACPTCGKPWTTELAAATCCPSLARTELDLNEGRRIDVTCHGDLVIDTSAADPESTYVPFDEDPYEEVRELPLETGDADDQALYDALMTAPDGGLTPRHVARFLADQAGRLTQRQHKLLAIYCAAKLNRIARRPWGAGLPPQAIEELRQVIGRHGKRG